MGCVNTDASTLPELPPGYKYMPCRHCDKPMIVRVVRKKLPAHIECSIELQQATMFQIRERRGPAYKKWVENTLKAAEALAREGYPLD